MDLPLSNMLKAIMNRCVLTGTILFITQAAFSQDKDHNDLRGYIMNLSFTGESQEPAHVPMVVFNDTVLNNLRDPFVSRINTKQAMPATKKQSHAGNNNPAF